MIDYARILTTAATSRDVERLARLGARAAAAEQTLALAGETLARHVRIELDDVRAAIDADPIDPAVLERALDALERGISRGRAAIASVAPSRPMASPEELERARILGRDGSRLTPFQLRRAIARTIEDRAAAASGLEAIAWRSWQRWADGELGRIAIAVLVELGAVEAPDPAVIPPPVFVLPPRRRFALAGNEAIDPHVVQILHAHRLVVPTRPAPASAERQRLIAARGRDLEDARRASLDEARIKELDEQHERAIAESLERERARDLRWQADADEIVSLAYATLDAIATNASHRPVVRAAANHLARYMSGSHTLTDWTVEDALELLVEAVDLIPPAAPVRVEERRISVWVSTARGIPRRQRGRFTCTPTPTRFDDVDAGELATLRADDGLMISEIAPSGAATPNNGAAELAATRERLEADNRRLRAELAAVGTSDNGRPNRLRKNPVPMPEGGGDFGGNAA